MTAFMLIRHGHCDPVGRYISGRKSGIHLSERGKKQAIELVDRLKETEIEAIYCSPLERARETALPLAVQRGLSLNIVEDLSEVDYGLWTGKSFEELSFDPLWAQYNTYRGRVRIPDGEMMLEVACRMSAFMERIRKVHSGTVVLVSHGDPIKSAIAHYAGIPLDFLLRFDVQPASVSILEIDDYGTQVLTVNNYLQEQDSVHDSLP